MPDAMTMSGPFVGRLPTEHAASIRRCRPRDVTAVAVLAAHCAWRRRRDAPFILRLLRLAIWPIGAALLTLDGRGLWVNRDRTAILATRPSTGRAVSLRFVLLLVSGVALPIAALGAVAAGAGAEDALIVAYGTLMVLLLDQLRRCRRNPALARARRDLSGPNVVEATNLLAASPGAGVELVRALCAMADATSTTVMAEARGAARQRLYCQFGFETVAEARGAALIVRIPR